MRIFSTLLFFLISISLSAQDPFLDLNGKPKVLPNKYEGSNVETKFRMTTDNEYNFVLKNRDMVLFKYDTIRPLGTLTYADLSMPDSADGFYSGDMFLKGKMDARKYYTKYKVPATGTFVLSAICPVFGAGLAIPASATVPRIENLGNPGRDLTEDRLYYQGYIDEAHRIKSRRVWLNFGVGSGIFLGILYGVIVATDIH